LVYCLGISTSIATPSLSVVSLVTKYMGIALLSMVFLLDAPELHPRLRHNSKMKKGIVDIL